MTYNLNNIAGAHERHLLRKSNNPLFGRPQYTSQDLERARFLDQEELKQFTVEMQRAITQCLELGETAETDDILLLKEQLEKLYERSCGLAGDLSNEQAAIQSVITPIMSAIEKNSKTDPKAMQKLDEEKTARMLHSELLKNKLVCDLLRPDSTIGESELPATLLSEPLEGLLPILDFFSKEQLLQLNIQANKLIEELALSENHTARNNLLALEQHVKRQAI